MKYKFILCEGDAVLEVLSGIETVRRSGEEGRDFELDSEEGTARMQGLKRDYLLVPEDVEVTDTLTDEIRAQAIDIPLKRSQDAEMTTLQAQLEETTRVLNAVSRQLIKSDQMTQEEREVLISQFRTVTTGDTVRPDEVVNIDGKLYRMVQPSPITIHDASWLSDPSLFTDFINPTVDPGTGEEVVVVDPYVQPTGAHDAYQMGDVVSFEGAIYESTMDGNIWSPTAYPAGWILVDNPRPASANKPKRFRSDII